MLEVLSMPHLRNLDLPELDYWLQEGEVPHYEFSKSFLDAQYDPVVVLHSSGSTGNPKALMWTHGLLAATDAFRLIPSLGGSQCIGSHWEEKRVFTLFPWYHAIGLIFYLPLAIYNGFTPVLPYSQRDNKPSTLKIAIEFGGVNAAFLAPSTLIELSKDVTFFPLLERLDHITYGGSILPLDAGEILSKRTRLMGCWGSTEAGILPTEVTGAEDWAYHKFSPFLGSHFRHFEDDLYEHVIVQTHLLQGFQGVFFTFPEVHEWPTRDLFRKHPTKKNLWLPSGRVDDVITFTDVRKLNPLLIEVEIQAHPCIDAAMICGQGRAQPALLLQPGVHKTSYQGGVDFVEEIWPFIQDVNRRSPLTGQLTKSLILLTSPEKPIAKAAGKNTILRKRTTDSYEVELDQLYQTAFLNSSVDALPTQIAHLSPNDRHDLPIQKTAIINQNDQAAGRITGLPLEHPQEQTEDMETIRIAEVELSSKETGSHKPAEALDALSRNAEYALADCPLIAGGNQNNVACGPLDDDDIWRLIYAVSQFST